MITTILSVITVVASTLFSIWAFFKFIISQNFRLDDNLSKIIIEKIREEGILKIEMNTEISLNKKYPSIYEVFCVLNGCFIFFKRNERLLNAGWQSKDTVSEIYFFRWQKEKIKNYIIEISKIDDSINVMLLQPYGSDKLGEIAVASPKINIDSHL